MPALPWDLARFYPLKAPYRGARTHLSSAKDAPTVPRRVLAEGNVIAFVEVGRLHHRYERHTA